MPVVDGWDSTRLIREQEDLKPMPSHAVQSFGRTPIFAVSGMLRRGDEQLYIDAGFNGWMPKPINMKWLGKCLGGAWDARARSLGAYDEDRFELGGWFPEPPMPPAKEEPPPREQIPIPIPEPAALPDTRVEVEIRPEVEHKAEVEVKPEVQTGVETDAPPVPDLIPQSPEEVYPPLPETPAQGPSSPTAQAQPAQGYFCQTSRPSKRNATLDVAWAIGPRGTPFEIPEIPSIDESLKMLGDQEEPRVGAERVSPTSAEYPHHVCTPWRNE